MVSQEYYLINRDYYLQHSKDYYNKYKEEIKEEARNSYSSLSPEEKQKKIDYSKNYYLNLPEDKKKEIIKKVKDKYHSMSDEQMQKHKEYLKNYQKLYRAKKKQELEYSKKEQCDFDKNAVLTPPKT